MIAWETVAACRDRRFQFGRRCCVALQAVPRALAYAEASTLCGGAMPDEAPSNPFAHLLDPKAATDAANKRGGPLDRLHSQVHLIQVLASRRRSATVLADVDPAKTRSAT